MLLCQPAGPGALGQAFQRFRFPDPGERVIQNRPDDRKCSRSDLALCLDPVLKILDELGMQDGRRLISVGPAVRLTLRQDLSSPGAIRATSEAHPSRESAGEPAGVSERFAESAAGVRFP